MSESHLQREQYLMWPLLLGAAPLAVAAWWDGKNRQIPNICILATLACAGTNVFTGWLLWQQAILGLLVIGGLMLICATRPSTYSAIGGGDVKLCATLGALVGLVDGLFVLAIALVAMLLYALVTRKKTLPLAPFLFGAYAAILIFLMWR